ncbi:hypothetical protein GCM10027059_37340 [Myceligenerans halotolerans]
MTSFVRVDGEFRPVSEAERHDGDCEYVPGAISLTVDGVELLGTELWDDVNWLWPFVVQAVRECRDSGSGTRHFPDQPITFKVEKAQWGGNVMLTVTTADRSIHRTAIAPEGEVYETVARAGAEFFKHLRRLCGSDAVSEEEEAATISWLTGER